MKFVPSWSTAYGIQAAARLDASGRYCTVAAPEPAKPPRPAVSLSSYRINYYIQGDAGTCYSHSPKQMAEVIAKGKGYDAFPISRRLIAWATKQMEDGGNPADGGSPTDAIVTMTTKGVGLAHEDLFPYTTDRNQLARRPGQEVFADATKSHLIAPVRASSLEEIIRLIDAGYPVANGWPAPSTLQQPGATFIDSIGSILGGHSVLIWGYIKKGVIDDHTWFELENWWELMYRPLPPSIAKLVEGYEPVRPDRTSSVMMRDDVYVQLCNLDGYAEHVSGTDLDGVIRGVVVKSPSFGEILL